MGEVILGTGEDGSDATVNDLVARFLLRLRERQEAVWAVVSQGHVLANVLTEDMEYQPSYKKGDPADCVVYVPERYQTWWQQNRSTCWKALSGAAQRAWGVDENWTNHNLEVEDLLSVPADLQHFVTQNTDRPKPRRYNTTAVQLYDRDGVAWLTLPEAKLYDALKQTKWTFVPQPPFLAGEEFDRRPDFLIFWRDRAGWPVLVEVDSDAYHPPSQRTHDEAREREFIGRGFVFLRYSAKEVNENPMKVVTDIAAVCTKRFGQ